MVDLRILDPQLIYRIRINGFSNVGAIIIINSTHHLDSICDLNLDTFGDSRFQ